VSALRRRDLFRRLAVTVVLVCATVCSACDGDDSAPDRLADGSPAVLSKVSFEGVDVPVVATELRTPRGPASTPCAERSGAIDRTAVAGTSRTAISPDGRSLRACDWTAHSGWCGVAYAQLRQTRPLDPRLTITCHDDDGEPLGFLWISPGSGTSYIVVTGPGYAEAYRVVRDLPVRVTTTQVDLETSSAVVKTSEHARDGRLLRSRRVEAHVSG